VVSGFAQQVRIDRPHAQHVQQQKSAQPQPHHWTTHPHPARNHGLWPTLATALARPRPLELRSRVTCRSARHTAPDRMMRRLMDLFVCDGAGKPRGRMDMWAVDMWAPSYDRRASLVYDNVARVPTDKKQDGHSLSTPHS